MTDQWLKRTEDKGPIGGYTESHPSYGSIQVVRVSGNTHLFGSEVQHYHFLEIRISETERVVNEPHEFISERRELVRVALSEAQFARMITSPNQGSGVACTIERCIADKDEPWVNKFGGRPHPPAPEHYTKKYKNALGERADLISKSITTAQEKIDGLVSGEAKPTKATFKELQDALRVAQMNLTQNLPYVMDNMNEGLEKTMATAVSEFESYVAASLQKKGLDYLASQAPKLSIAEQKALPEETE